MELLKGAEVSAKMKEQAAQILEQLGGNVPKLAIVRVGERPDDMSYERGATKKMESFGLRVQSYVFPEDIGHQEFKEAFININQDEDVTGILFQSRFMRRILNGSLTRQRTWTGYRLPILQRYLQGTARDLPHVRRKPSSKS